MNTTLKSVLTVFGIIFIAAGLVAGGLFLGQALAIRQAGWQTSGWTGMMGFRAGEYNPRSDAPSVPGKWQQRGGMMGGYGGGMMGGYGGGMMGGYGTGMMGGYGNGYGGGMMGGYNDGGSVDAEPLTLHQAEEAVQAYLDRWGNDDLEIREIMIFDNQAYAEIVESSTGIGAMEVLVDPVTLAVYPEYGPNMMWNLKYGHMGGGGGMMGWNQPDADADMTVTPDEAITAAQDYLDAYYPGLEVGDEVDAFYGYYTLHTLKDGKVVGMLSVNGFSGQVWLHTWHGTFIEMSEEHD